MTMALERAQAAQRRVAPFMLVALASLLVGLWAGLGRLGWDLKGADGELMLKHGALMVVGFVATLIAVERGVAVRSLPAFAAPALSAAVAVALVAGAPAKLPPALATAAGAAYSLNIGLLLLRHRQPALAVLWAGALCLAVAGAVWWDGGGLRAVVPWWIAFLVLTIAGERLELIRFQRFTTLDLVSGLAVLALLAIGPVITLWDVATGVRVMGLALLAGPVWLVQRDIARRTVRTDGLARFAATGVLTAYAWLAVAGAMLLAWGLEPGLRDDAAVHAFFIGFVFTAIIAHEPIIAPSVTGLRFVYTPALYLPLVLLDGALVVRVVADLAEWAEVRRWSGMVQALTVCLFLLLSALSVVLGRFGAPLPRAPAARQSPAGLAAGSDD